jgi:hypothetical protein
MKLYRLFILFFALSGLTGKILAQDDKKQLRSGSAFTSKNDTLQKPKAPASLPKQDSLKKHDPRIATRRSAILPGWGQAYNKEYWKIPIVYGILAIPASLYFYNNSYYKKTKFAYEARYKEAHGDSSDVAAIDPQLVNLSISSLQSYRNSFRRDRDYSILWFLIAWGLQVADATVFAHLKSFDVSNDLSMEINPVFNPITHTPGLSLSLNLKNSSRRQAISR